jgi:hypothetical protein
MIPMIPYNLRNSKQTTPPIYRKRAVLFTRIIKEIMKKLGQSIATLTEKEEKYQKFLANSEKGSPTEWYNRLQIQHIRCEIREKVNELLVLIK